MASILTVTKLLLLLLICQTSCYLIQRFSKVNTNVATIFTCLPTDLIFIVILAISYVPSPGSKNIQYCNIATSDYCSIMVVWHYLVSFSSKSWNYVASKIPFLRRYTSHDPGAGGWYEESTSQAKPRGPYGLKENIALPSTGMDSLILEFWINGIFQIVL